MTICPHSDCTGCFACQNACTHDALRLMPGEYGYIYPVVDSEKCVNCGLCRKVCPVNTPVAKHTVISADIARAASAEEIVLSSSGGIATVLVREVLRQGGVVYGSTGVDGSNVCHIRIDSEDKVDLLKGSKYVQSHINDVYRQVKSDLSDGIKVLFIGTPCQNAGLRNYLHRDYDSLVCVDFICHGVPSHELLSRHVVEMTSLTPEQTGKVTFRTRDSKGRSIYGVTVCDSKGNLVYSSHYPKDEYITAFIHGVTYRESCYSCKYATRERVSDITLGDYWDKEHRFGLEGLSMLLVNTDKGRSLFQAVKSSVNIIDHSDVDTFAVRNQQLKEPMRRNPRRDIFLELYPTQGFCHAAHTVLIASRKAMRNQRIKDFFFKLPFLQTIYNTIRPPKQP